MRTTIGAAVLAWAVLGLGLQPRITGVLPQNPAVSPKAQTLTVLGEGFEPGLSLLVTTPGGAVTTFAGADIAARRATSFQVAPVLDAVGRYSLVVANEDGSKSSAFAFEVRAAARQQPWIDQVTPPELAKSTDPQVVTLAGGNFAPSLRVSLSDPTGTVTQSAQIDKVEAHTVVLRLVFDQTGPYELMVTNPSGESSNTVVINVR